MASGKEPQWPFLFLWFCHSGLGCLHCCSSVHAAVQSVNCLVAIPLPVSRLQAALRVIRLLLKAGPEYQPLNCSWLSLGLYCRTMSAQHMTCGHLLLCTPKSAYKQKNFRGSHHLHRA